MKEEIIKLIRDEFEHGAHPQVTDDFDTVWAIHEKYTPFSDDAYVPATEYDVVHFADLTVTSKKELMEKISEIPNDALISFEYEGDSVRLYTSMPYTESNERTACKLYNSLILWASLQHYRLYKELYMCEKQNAELMKQVNANLSNFNNG